MNFGNLTSPHSDLDQARAVIISAPFEASTTGGKGTADAPQAIIQASDLIESFDEERGIELSDVGVATLPAIRFKKNDAPAAIERTRVAVLEQLAAGRFPIVLGGEHTITPGAVAAVARFLGKKPTLVQIDAHADLREEYLNDRYNHACAMRLSLPHCRHLLQLGVRAVSREEYRFIGRSKKTDCLVAGNTSLVQAVEAVSKITGPVYLTVDMDGFDPSEVPGVGTPEPGGFTWRQVSLLVRTLFQSADVIGADIVELMPVESMLASQVTAAKLAWRMISWKFF